MEGFDVVGIRTSSATIEVPLAKCIELQGRLVQADGGQAVIGDLKNGSIAASRKRLLLATLTDWGMESGAAAMGPALMKLREEMMRDLNTLPFNL